MQATAKIFMNNRSQAVRLPKEFQFKVSEVYIRKQGEDVILSPRPKDWSAFLTSDAIAPPDYMDDVEDLPPRDLDL
jgi:antitoxin VapB